MEPLPNIEILLLIIFAGTLFIIYWFSTKGNEEKTQQNTYLSALEYLVAGNDRLAIEKLKETVKADSDNIEAYIKLGDILRERGLRNNAIRIHRDLTLRSGLADEIKAKIYTSLFYDYLGDDNKRAIEAAKTVLRLDSQVNSRFLEAFLKLLIQTEEWDQALQLLKDHGDKFTNAVNKTEALLKVFKGCHLEVQQLFKEARIWFKDALKIDEACPAAHYFLGKSYLKENRREDAVKVWTKFCRQFPQKSYFLYTELEKVWFDLGRFTDAENLYLDLLNQNPKNLFAGLALARIYSKKGDHENALEIIQQMEEYFPDSVELLRFKIEYHFHRNQYKQAAAHAIEYFQTVYGSKETIYECQECNFKTETPLWFCPKCKAINSFGLY
jgi:lipopolysaccharide biosynthesis regulator YciM